MVLTLQAEYGLRGLVVNGLHCLPSRDASAAAKPRHILCWQCLINRIKPVNVTVYAATSRGLGFHSASTNSLHTSQDGDADGFSSHAGPSHVRTHPDTPADPPHPTGMQSLPCSPMANLLLKVLPLLLDLCLRPVWSQDGGPPLWSKASCTLYPCCWDLSLPLPSSSGSLMRRCWCNSCT